MTRGRLIWIADEKGNCLHTQEFNGDFGPDQSNGRLAISKLKTCKTFEQFSEAALCFLKLFGYDEDFEDYQLKNNEFLGGCNLIKTDFHNEPGRDGVGTYYWNWHADFLYIVNVCGKDIETKDFDNEPISLENGYLTILDFGKSKDQIQIVDEVPVTEEINKMEDKYEPPVKTLKEVVEEYEIKFTKDDLLTIDNLQGVLDSGVEECTLWYDKDKDAVTVQGKFKSVACTNVKVKKISNKGNICDNIPETKLHIQCSHWLFPCPDYRRSNIKRNLERAICAILDIGSCEVESFSTGIVENDSDKE